MRAIGLGSITLATLALTANDDRVATNTRRPHYPKPDNENCTFATFEQCQATVWGVGGWCRPNPFPNTAFGTGWSWSQPPRQSRGGRERSREASPPQANRGLRTSSAVGASI